MSVETFYSKQSGTMAQENYENFHTVYSKHLLYSRVKEP